jgi:Tol biopolymer transport system component
MSDSMRTVPHRSHGSPVSHAEATAQLRRILAHPLFENSDRLSRLLSYLVEQDFVSVTGEIKEYTIGLDVFDRDPSFDPRQDSVVRANATRLRTKLTQYYQGDGKNDPVTIELRRGTYRPVLLRRLAVVEAPPALIAIPKRPQPPTKGRLWIAAVAVGALAIAVGPGLFLFRNYRPAASSLTPRPLFVGPGLKRTPAFSPDGQTVAFEWNPEGQTTAGLYLQGIDSDTPTRLTAPDESVAGAAWSPDGQQVAFFRGEADDHFSLVSMPAKGGAETRWADIEIRPTLDTATVDWTRDGRYLVAADRSKGDPMAVVLISTATKRKYWITSPPAGTLGDGPVRVSPDGRWIAFRRTTGASMDDVFVMAFPASPDAPGAEGEHTVRRLTNKSSPIYGLDWSEDSKSVVISAALNGARPSLYRVPIDGGEPVRMAEPGIDARMPALSRQGNRLAWIAESVDISLWRIPAEGGTPTRLIAASGLNSEPQYSPDGQRIVFRSNRSGYDELWSSDAEGGNLHRLTNFRGPLTGSARWSSDGTRLVFETRIDNVSSLCMASFGGKPDCAIDPAGNAGVASWSRDGKWIYFGSNREDGVQVWKRPSAGGPAIRVTRGGGFQPFESPDGVYLYYSRGKNGQGLWRIPVSGGEETPIVPDLPNNCWGDWAVTREGVYYIAPAGGTAGPNAYAIYRIDPTTKATRVVARIDGLPVRWDSALTASPDGRYLLFARQDRDGTELMIAESK